MSFSEMEEFQKYIHTFHLNYYSLVNIIKDSTHLSILLNKLSMRISAHPSILSKNMFHEINNQFICHFEENINVYLTITNIVELDYYFSIKWKITSSPALQLIYPNYGISKDHQLFLTISLHNLGQDKTFFVFGFSGYNLNQTFRDLNNNNLKLNKILQLSYQKLYKYLKVRFRIQSQREYKFINVNFDIAKEYFLHVKICTSLVGEIISYSEELIKKGSVVVYRNPHNVKCVIQVRKVEIKDNSMHLKFFIYEGTKSNQPHRELKVELFAVNVNDTFVILTHSFFKKVNKDRLDNVSLSKKKLLRKLSTIIEKTCKLNCSVNKVSIMERKVITEGRNY